jgi:YD repeat-containing protein
MVPRRLATAAGISRNDQGQDTVLRRIGERHVHVGRRPTPGAGGRRDHAANLGSAHRRELDPVRQPGQRPVHRDWREHPRQHRRGDRTGHLRVAHRQQRDPSRDEYRRHLREHGPLGLQTYNAAGEVTQETTPLPAGQTSSTPYETTSYTYDADGNLTETDTPPATTGGADQVTEDKYNSSGELWTQTTGSGTSAAATVSYCYDDDGNKTSVVAAEGNISGVAPCETSAPWTVDPSANPAQAAYQTVYTYNTGGTLTSTQTPNGVTTTSSSTPDGQVSGISYSGPGAPSSVSYGYDVEDKLTSVTDSTGTSTRTDDPFDGLTSEASGGSTVSYSYDADGDTTGVTYPLPAAATWAASDTVGYGYDKAGNLASVTDFAGSKIVITTTSDGQPASVTLGSTGDTIGLAYGQDDNPSSITLANASGTTLQGFAYKYAPTARFSARPTPRRQRAPPSPTPTTPVERWLARRQAAARPRTTGTTPPETCSPCRRAPAPSAARGTRSTAATASSSPAR